MYFNLIKYKCSIVIAAQIILVIIKRKAIDRILTAANEATVKATPMIRCMLYLDCLALFKAAQEPLGEGISLIVDGL